MESTINSLNDGLVDTDTGREWLDLSQTVGLSVNGALATNFVTSQGFTHATSAQVQTLFLNAGFATTNNVNKPVNNPAATLLLDVMGCTKFCGTINATGRGFAVYNATFTIRPNYHLSGLGAGAAVISLFSSVASLEDQTSGHFLVREARAVPVPEPGTLSLLGAGLLGLSLFRRRRAI